LALAAKYGFAREISAESAENSRFRAGSYYFLLPKKTKGESGMRFKHKYLNPIILYICVFVFGLFILGASDSIVDWIYAYLNHLFPKSFPIYNQIYDIETYNKLERIKDIWSIFIALVMVNLIALRLDNKKYERLINLTDGEYLVCDGIKLYFKEFFISDLIVSILIPATLVVPAFFLTEEVLSYFGLIFWNWLGYNMKFVLELFPAILVSAAFSFIGRMLAIPICVRAWRAAWMTDI
jgi:hypothetical protein